MTCKEECQKNTRVNKKKNKQKLSNSNVVIYFCVNNLLEIKAMFDYII